jgi:hypothetical protein
VKINALSGTKPVPARDPFLDFLFGNTWLDGLLLAGIARAVMSSIVIAVAHGKLRPD